MELCDFLFTMGTENHTKTMQDNVQIESKLQLQQNLAKQVLSTKNTLYNKVSHFGT